MLAKWRGLRQQDQEAYLKIITGAESINYFDTFAEEWKSMGGDIITKEVNILSAVK